MLTPARRSRLPRATDRLPLGSSGLQVSPICLGMTMDPETVTAAYDAGVNFFFVTADLHWPLYDPLRRGLARLLQGAPSRRREIVVGVVSYLDNPLFSALQFNEVIGEIPGLEYVDLAIAGAASSQESFYSRVEVLSRARANRHMGISAIGTTFHQRSLAAVADHYGLVDIGYIRYNSAHPGARHDLFPLFRPQRSTLVYNFKSVMSHVTRDVFEAMKVPASYWLPSPPDYYRFVLSRPEIDGILCSPMQPSEVSGLAAALEQPPLTPEEEQYMVWLSSTVHAAVLT